MAAPTIKTGLDKTHPMTFAKTRHGYLIGVNGINRGIFWDGRTEDSCSELGIDGPTNPPVVETPTVEKQATGTVTIATSGGAAADIAGNHFSITDAYNKTVNYNFRNNSNYAPVVGGRFATSNECKVDIYGLTGNTNFAEQLMYAIRGPYGHNGTILVSQASGVLTLTQLQGGTTGNTAITENDPGTDLVAVSFSGGVSTGNSGFTAVVVADGDAAHGMTAGEKITLTSSDGTIIDYFVSDTGDGGVAHLSAVTAGATLKSTGSITASLTSGATGISVGFNLSSGTQNAYLVLLKAAIEHANGHNGKIVVSSVPGVDDGPQSIILYQTTAGPEGNTSITTDISQLTAPAFDGGTNVIGATGGDYTCFYRYIDEREGSTFYSNLSPFQVVGADEDDGFFWTNLTASSQSRVTHVQLLRTTFNQATTAYVVATLPHGGIEGNVNSVTAAGAIRVPKGSEIVSGMRVTISNSNQAKHNQTVEVTGISSASSTEDEVTHSSGDLGGVASSSSTIKWTLEGYTEDKLTDGQMVLFRGDYRQKLLQADGRPAANRHAIPPFFKSVCCAFQDRMTYLVDPTYSTGQVSVYTEGSTSVTGNTSGGNATGWTTDLEGRIFCPNPADNKDTYIIESINEATQVMTLNKGYLGSSDTNKTYTIINPPEERNTIYISEQDLPESVITQIAIQENIRDEDELVGAVVMGAQYYALKEHSIYRITWGKTPLLDAQPQLAAMRGAISHRCADQHENVLYLMDEEGPYALTGNTVNPIGVAVADQWSDQLLDFSKKSTWSVRVDPLEELVYFFVTGSGEDRPKRALVYDIRTSMWSKWTYSWEVGDCVKLTWSNQRRLIMGSKNDNFYVMNEGLRDGGSSASNNITYSWKSGMFAWVESEGNTKRYIRVTFKPTTNDATMDIKKYDNHETSPAVMHAWDDGDGVSVEDGANKAVANLKLTQHADGNEPGSKVLPWSGKLPLLRGRPIRWVTCELTGQQSLDRIIVYEIEIGGVK
tara:strand:+ start:543 stop:3536 length:2994 start_codon:yes stop_codon:yes gene_type:complete